MGKRMTAAPILAANNWTSNAELIADVARLGYIRDDDSVLDPTFGLGTWWKRYQPAHLAIPVFPEFDFRDMPYKDDMFDVVAYDPPYVCIGGRTTTGIPEFHERYGLTETPRSPFGLQMYINEGLDECWRVARRHVFVKCQSYISSGKLWPGEFKTYEHAMSLGLVLEDRFVHVTHPRPQPHRDRQVHARNNTSTLFIFRKKTSKRNAA